MATFLSVSSCTSPKAGGAGLYFFPSRKVEELVKGKKVHQKKKIKKLQKKKLWTFHIPLLPIT